MSDTAFRSKSDDMETLVQLDPAAPSRPARAATPRAFGSTWRVVLTLADQGVVSVATFATGVMISRSTQSGFGMYALVLTLWVLAGEVLNSLILTPHMLRLPRLNAVRARRFNGSLLIHQLALSSLLTIGLLMIAAAMFVLERPGRTGGDDRYALVALMTAISVGPIALRSFVRGVCFAMRDPVSALAIDCGVSLVQVAGVGVLFLHGGLQHWWAAVLVIASANLLSAGTWLAASRQRFAPSLRRALGDLARTWRMSRLIFASSMLWVAGGQAYPWLISLIAGHSAAGIWGACVALANLGNPLLMGIQNSMGPAIAHAHAERTPEQFRRYVTRCSIVFVALVLPPSIAFSLLSNFLLLHVNGGNYAGYGAVTGVLAFSLVMQGVSFPTSRGLFSLGYAGFDMLANVGPLVVLACFGPLLVMRYGLVGGAACLLTAQAVGSIVRVCAFYRLSRVRGTTATPLAIATYERSAA